MSSPIQSSGSKSARKQAYFKKLFDLVENHSQILIVEANNVGSRQLAEIRLALRGKATLLMGKNTMIRTALRQKVNDMPELENLIPLVKDNVGLFFCKEDASEIRKVIMEHKVPAPAKQGSVAPCNVVIPAGPTGMDPGQTSFFQALQIATKIVKGQIEIQQDVNIIKEGDKVNASQAVLLARLGIKPFTYGLKSTVVYENGTHYPAAVLDIESSELLKRVSEAAQLVAAFSLEASVPTTPSVPHSLITAFRQVAAIAIEAEVIFPAIEGLAQAVSA